MNKTLRNTIIVIAAVVLVVVLLKLSPKSNYRAKYDGFDFSTVSGSVDRENTYKEYLTVHSSKYPQNAVSVDILNFDAEKSHGVHAESGYQGKEEALVTDDGSLVTWNVDVPEEGFYNISVTYIGTPSRNVSMERSVSIGGKIPFSGADTLTFNRLWHDGGDIRVDNRGNQIRPSQTEVFDWQTLLLKSHSGYEVEPYKFYFTKGINQLAFESTNEPMVISDVSLLPVRTLKTYSQYVASQPVKPENYKGTPAPVVTEGENSIVRSEPSLFARPDRSSPITQPYSVKTQVLNFTGGDSWKIPGQWIEWEMEVPEDGWYTLSVQARQVYQRGYIAVRSFYIDGEIPFAGVESVEFPYSSDWNFVTLSDNENNPYQFYLKKGKHNIRMEASLGSIGKLIGELEDSVFRMNIMYRTILVLTGASPDANRDYEIHKVYPEVVEAMNIESKRLYKLVDDFAEITGERSNLISPALQLAVQLEQFYKRPNKITENFINFKSNITSLGTSLLTLTEGKLDVDFIQLTGINDKPKAPKSNFFKKAGHEIRSFFISFFVDSSQFGDVYDKDDEHLIEVWITSARDQVTVLKSIVDDSFTPLTGIHANVKLISADALLNAVVAGNGPDVVLSVGSNLPVDYALRNANVDLTKFDDYEEVLKNFNPSSYEGYKYDGGIFGLPETETFNLMFYRKDILEQLEVEVPQTWDDLIAILPTIQGNNLEVGIPFPSIQAPDLSGFYSMLFQNGGEVYNERGTKTLIDSEAGVTAFKLYSGFFNSYSLPTVYDFTSRFRSGEMPIGIVNYATYNNLAVAAPEIRGLWDFTYIPGTRRVDENGNVYIDRSTGVATTCCMMINKEVEKTVDTDAVNDFYGSSAKRNKEEVLSERQKKLKRATQRELDSWEFMKWWTSTDAQVRFAREMEAVLGSSGRQTTANVEALRQLPWNSKQLKILTDSLDTSVGVPEVPGSYYTQRHVVNGIRMVVNTHDDPRETLIDYARKINDELTRKRQEFNLPVEE